MNVFTICIIDLNNGTLLNILKINIFPSLVRDKSLLEGLGHHLST